MNPIKWVEAISEGDQHMFTIKFNCEHLVVYKILWMSTCHAYVDNKLSCTMKLATLATLFWNDKNDKFSIK